MKLKDIVVGVALLGMATAGFAEGADHGIRVSAGVGPGIDSFDYSGVENELSDDPGAQIEVLYQRRHWSKSTHNFAWIWGAGLLFGTASGSNDAGGQIDLTTFAVMAQGGMAKNVADAFILEFQPYLALGGSNAEITGFTDGGAAYAMLGVKAGLFIPVTDSIEIGFELGYQGHAAEVELDFGGGNTTDGTISGDGLHGAGVVAFKF